MSDKDKIDDILNNSFPANINKDIGDGIALTSMETPKDFPWDKIIGMIKLHSIKPKGEA